MNHVSFFITTSLGTKRDISLLKAIPKQLCILKKLNIVPNSYKCFSLSDVPWLQLLKQGSPTLFLKSYHPADFVCCLVFFWHTCYQMCSHHEQQVRVKQEHCVSTGAGSVSEQSLFLLCYSCSIKETLFAQVDIVCTLSMD